MPETPDKQAAEFRARARQLFERIDRAFAELDPDLAECEWSQGALVIEFSNGSRSVLSIQPAVQQVWLALGGKGVAFHFQWDAAREQWADSSHGGKLLADVLKSHVLELTRQPLAI